MASKPKYCEHCGLDGNCVDRTLGGKTFSYHEDCFTQHLSRCKDVVSKFKETNAVSFHVPYMALNVKYLYGTEKTGDKMKDQFVNQEKKKQRTAKLKELTDIVSALRNSTGGYLLIQIVGIDKEELYTGAFDEFADKKLYDMIEDGSLFDEAYKKSWLKNDPDTDLKCFYDFLVLYVEKGLYWSTSDFKTKLALDFNLETPLPSTMRRFVNRERMENTSDNESSTLRGFTTPSVSDLYNLQECRTIQLKSILHKDVIEDPNNFGLKIWTDLRLQEYVTAFTKNQEGGSYFLGIGERSIQNKGYNTKLNTVQGFCYQHSDKLKAVLEEMIKSELLYVEGGDKSLSDLVKIRFIPVYNNNSVMEVAVSTASGFVFYDKAGPESYVVRENKLERINAEQWLDAMRRNGTG